MFVYGIARRDEKQRCMVPAHLNENPSGRAENEAGMNFPINAALLLIAGIAVSGCVSSVDQKTSEKIAPGSLALTSDASGRGYLSGSGIRYRSALSKRNVLNIRADRGGELIRYMRRVKRASEQKTNVRVSGNCDSACTLFLALPRKQICVLPGATFRFHHPYGSTKRNNTIAAKYMMKSYPMWVRSWIRGKGGLSNHLKAMSYEYVSRHLNQCKTA